jgi:hypothetical protein
MLSQLSGGRLHGVQHERGGFTGALNEAPKNKASAALLIPSCFEYSNLEENSRSNTLADAL